jgi:hypothetical protein
MTREQAMVRGIWLVAFCLAFSVSGCGSDDGDGSESSGGTGDTGATGGTGGSAPNCDDAFATVPVPYAPNTSIEEWGGFAVDESGAVFSVIPDTSLTDDTSAYDSLIMASDLAGNLTTLYTGTGTSLFGKMILHGDSVYMLAGFLAPGIARMPRSGGEPVEVVDDTVLAGPILRGAFIYYATGGFSDAGIYRLDPETDTSTLLVARGETEIVTLDLDGDTLFWIESDGLLEDTDYRLFSMPVDGDTVEMLQELPRAELALGNFRVIDGVLFGAEITEDFDIVVTRTPIGQAPEIVDDSGGTPMVIADGFAYYGSGTGITKAPLSFESKTIVPGTEGRVIYSLAVGPDDLWYSEVSCIFRAAK